MEEKMARMPGKSNFSIACSLLSQYMKQKRNLGDLMAACSYEAKGTNEPPTTMSLFPGVIVSRDEDDLETKKLESLENNTTKPMDLLPQHTTNIHPTSSLLEDTTKDANNRDKEKAQLTIFYGGKVLVFDNFPSEKAKDLLEMAKKTCSPMQDFSFSTASSTMEAKVSDELPKGTFQHSDAVDSSSVGNARDGNQDHQPKPTHITASNVPGARRASLHRFLVKRKDRINAKAPYQINESPLQGKPEESLSWLGLGLQQP